MMLWVLHQGGKHIHMAFSHGQQFYVALTSIVLMIVPCDAVQGFESAPPADPAAVAAAAAAALREALAQLPDLSYLLSPSPVMPR
jgi:hypothetical protein